MTLSDGRWGVDVDSHGDLDMCTLEFVVLYGI